MPPSSLLARAVKTARPERNSASGGTDICDVDRDIAIERSECGRVRRQLILLCKRIARWYEPTDPSAHNEQPDYEGQGRAFADTFDNLTEACRNELSLGAGVRRRQISLSVAPNPQTKSERSGLEWFGATLRITGQWPAHPQGSCGTDRLAKTLD